MIRQQRKRRAAKSARDWIVTLESGAASAAERKHFEAWLADPDNRAAYRRSAGIWQAVAGMEQLAQLEPRHRQQQSAGRRLFARISWPTTALAAGVAMLMVAIAVNTVPSLFKPITTEYRTEIAETRALELKDGSVITLGARSRIAVTLSDDERRVALNAGEAFFSVAPDPQRPFSVQAGDTRVEVVGTEFNVHTGPGRVTVAVAEGVVDVFKAESGQTPVDDNDYQRRRLAAGQQVVSMHWGDLGEVKTIAADQAGSWRSGHLVYNKAPLREVIADANRYSDNSIIIVTEQLGELTVTASFRSDEIDKMITSLAAVLPIEVEQVPDGRIVVKREMGDGRREM